MPKLADLIGSLSTPQLAAWAGLAFCFWIALRLLVYRLRMPSAGLVAATLSWLIAWLVIWAAPTVLHELLTWSGR
ncbi:MAG TPA: hypothetical protein VIA61_11805 [Methylomirabilota bacterium]|jgi:hypothetical protein